MKQYLKYWCSPGYPSNTLPGTSWSLGIVWSFRSFLRSETPLLETAVLKCTFFLPFRCWKTFRYFFYIFHPLFVSPRGIICGFWTSKMRHIGTYKSWPGEENGGPGFYFIINVRWEQWTNCNWCCQHLHFQKGFGHVYEIYNKSFW